MSGGRGKGRPVMPGRRPDLSGMRDAVSDLIRASGFDRLEGELRRTPARAAKAWRDHLLAGYRAEPSKILEPLRSSTSRDLVAVRDLEFVSTCVHHLLPFHGRVHLAYLPAGRIVGVSRLATLVDALSRRLQVQEEMTSAIARALHVHLGARGAACVVEAVHLCMAARGERGASGTVVTASYAGCYEEDPRLRSQVLVTLGLRRDPVRGRTGRGRR